jgi:macrodomain Ter protein organizer (MatP/YcbG family)
MTKTADILKTEHHKQVAWLKKQIEKNNTSIFLNPSLAVPAFDALNSDFITPDEHVERYIFRYLSDSGKKKLVTTLRVAETRRKKSFLVSLQVNLEPNNNQRLTELSKQSGLTKTELVNKMIQCANWKKREEEQLEINL